MSLGEVNTVKDGLVFSIDGTNKISGFQDDTRSVSVVSSSQNLTVNTSDFNILSGTSFTICFWLNITNNPAANTDTILYYKPDDWGTAFQFACYSQGAAVLFRMFDNDAGVGVNTSNIAFPYGQWGFITIGYDHTINQFRSSLNDGVFSNPSLTNINTSTSSGTFALFKPYIGAVTNSFGKMDNLCFYNKALSVGERDTLYNNGLGTSFDNADKDQLVSWWSFNEESGTRVDRMSVNNLIDTGSVGVSTGFVQEPFSFDYVRNIADGTMGSGLNGVSLDNTNSVSTRVWEFDGVNDYIDITDIEVGTIYTVDVWIQKAATNSGILFGDAGSEFIFYFNLNTNISINTEGGGVTYHNVTVPTMALNTWYNVVYVRNGINGELWLNGVSQGTTADLGTNTQHIRRIGSQYDGSLPFNGKLSNVKVYDRTLTPVEVKQNYEALKYRYI